MSFRYIKVKTKGQIEGEKLLVPKLRFKKFNNEYKKYKIGDTLKVKSGKDQKLIECTNGKYPILGTGGQIGTTNNFLYDKPSVLIGRKGTINKPQYMTTPFWTVDTLFYTDIKEGFNTKYIFYAFQNINWKKYDESTGVPSLSCKTIEEILYYIPNKDEQDKISTFITLLDKKIELQQRRIEALKIYKRGLIKKIFGDIKDNNSIRLKDLYHFAYGEGNTNPDNGGIYPVYGANGKIGGFNKYNAEYSVIIGHMGAYAGNVLFEENKHFVTYNGTIAIPKNIKILRPKFGYYMLLNANLPRICAGSGMPFLSYEILNNIKVKLPNIKAQEKCEKVLEKTEAKIKLEKRKFKNLSQLKKSLLQQMFI